MVKNAWGLRPNADELDRLGDSVVKIPPARFLRFLRLFAAKNSGVLRPVDPIRFNHEDTKLRSPGIDPRATNRFNDRGTEG